MKATVVVLTFNAEPYLKELLDAVERQKLQEEFEILVIDSGSTDNTLEIINSYKKARLHQIPNTEFGHGKTRNLAARLAKGEFVVYLTHDAVPAHDRWLAEMLKPFEIGEKVVCVFGKQIPRADCCPPVKRDIIGVFNGFGPDQFISLQQANPIVQDQASKDSLTFFSDVNSAVRKQTLLHDIPYQDLSYSEDYAFGKDVINAGLIKAYAPYGSVIHSHSYPPKKYFQRMLDEMLGLKKATGVTLNTSFPFHISWIIKNTLKDWLFIWSDPSYGIKGKIKYFLQSPLYNSYRRVAIYLAAQDTLPNWAKNQSLEAQLKKKAG